MQMLSLSLSIRKTIFSFFSSCCLILYIVGARLVIGVRVCTGVRHRFSFFGSFRIAMEFHVPSLDGFFFRFA